MTSLHAVTNESEGAQEVVLTFIEALNKEDFQTVRACLNDDMVFDGVLGHREGADQYVLDMQQMKFKYHIQKTFVSGNEVCLLYDINMSGKTIFNCGWYHVQCNKIKSLKVVFDPRPLLEQK